MRPSDTPALKANRRVVLGIASSTAASGTLRGRLQNRDGAISMTSVARATTGREFLFSITAALGAGFWRVSHG